MHLIRKIIILVRYLGEEITAINKAINKVNSPPDECIASKLNGKSQTGTHVLSAPKIIKSLNADRAVNNIKIIKIIVLIEKSFAKLYHPKPQLPSAPILYRHWLMLSREVLIWQAGYQFL